MDTSGPRSCFLAIRKSRSSEARWSRPTTSSSRTGSASQAGIGGVTGGSMQVDDELGVADIDIGAGWIGSLSGSYNVLDGTDDWPFLVLTLTVGAASAQTTAPPPRTSGRLFALDLRFGAGFGYTLANTFSPYVAARVFGGPVEWELDGEDITGSDKHHYQLGGGLVVSLPANLDLYAEGVPLGERAVTAGLGFTY